MQEILTRVQREVTRQGWDALWVSKAANRRYLTGFSGSSGWVLVPARGKTLLLTDGRYAEQARLQTRGLKLLIAQKDPRTQFAGFLRRNRLERLAFEDEDLSVAAWREMKKQYPGLKGFPASGLVEQHRAVKAPAELALLREAVRQTQTAWTRFQRFLKAGRTERDLAVRLDRLLHEAGAEELAFPTIMASGPNAALPHATPTERRLRAGDLVVIDFGGRYRGYHADLTRTVAVGRATERQRKVYAAVKRAQTEAQKRILPGHSAAECDKTARSIFRRLGWEKQFLHSLGHGLGLEIHEGPRLSQASRDVLRPGMVVTCEPGLYFPGWGGVRIEDDLTVTDRGSEWLSQSPETLDVAGK